MHALGRHLLVELHGCQADLLKKVDVVKEIMLEAARASRATIIDSSFHEFSPFGVSGVVVIAESHLSIHTWPEYRYAAVDFFTCGDTIAPWEAVEYIITRFHCKNHSIMEMKRGIISGKGKLPHKVVVAPVAKAAKVAKGLPDAKKRASGTPRPHPSDMRL